MFERSEFALKVICGAVGALVVYRLGLAVVHINPLAHVTIPALPVLASAPASAAAAKGTNSPSAHLKPGTNVAHEASASKGTSVMAQATNTIGHTTNTVAQGTNTIAG